MEQTSGRIGVFLLTLMAAAFCLNWLWEMLQMPAYGEMAGRPGARRLVPVPWLPHAVGAMAAGNLRWATPIRWNSLVAIAKSATSRASALSLRKSLSFKR